MALVTHYVVGLDWPTLFLVGAVLATTDPVFASGKPPISRVNNATGQYN